MADEKLTQVIIGAVIEVHQHLGAGLLGSSYEQCLCVERDSQNINLER